MAKDMEIKKGIERWQGMIIWKYIFEDGTKLEMLNVGLSNAELHKLMELHRAVIVDYEIRK